MTSRLVTTLATLSTLACRSAIGIWIRSYAYPVIEFMAHDGKLLIANFDINPERFATLAKYEGGTNAVVLTASGMGTVYHHALGFAYISRNNFYQVGPRPEPVYRILVMPLWAIVLATAALPAWWFYKRRQFARRRRTGQCQACGYDLRGTPHRCPECGALTAPAAANRPAEC